ncbi:MAG: ATP-binding protein [Desulfobacteraceae bacterium]|jgi:hypothetical protein|nr:MAG: ATP-binding protein [Desulfobacteraceae bacterium]
MISKNPFYFRELPTDGPFCNREQELQELCSHAQSLANVVLYSPRRFGKTSLIKRVQEHLAQEDVVTIYTHFYGVTSVEDLASRMAKAVFKITQAKEPLFKKAVRIINSYRPTMVMTPDEEKGMAINVQLASTGLSGFELLEDVMESLGKFIKETDELIHFVIDEFQEIVELPDVLKIEGILRQHIQQHQASYTFVGSRRRILLSIFNEKHRPFYKSAINYELQPLPRQEFAGFIAEQFSLRGKECSHSMGELIADTVRCFPYYAQKLAYFVFERSGDKVEEKDVKLGIETLFRDETPTFEGVLLGLAPQQIALLRAIALEPSHSIFSQEYLRRHRLGSTGGAQAAKKKLLKLDLIEQDNKTWRVVDPIMDKWLRKYLTGT